MPGAGAAATTLLSEVMTPNPTTMLPDQTPFDALRLMTDGGFRHLPLVKNRRIVGLVSRGAFEGFEQHDNEEERYLWEHLR